VERNRARDARVARRLRREGWSVLRVWEHCLRDEEAVARRVARALERRRG
jgi:DNA mismatch endonuclease (patch repair protein)